MMQMFVHMRRGTEAPNSRSIAHHQRHDTTLLFWQLLMIALRDRVNWESGSKASYEVKEGDMVSVSGKGRLEIKAVSETKKGKFSVEMVRYV